MISTPEISEDVLQDPRYPVHRIASQLRPYLQVLAKEFQPQQVILFGSYAYGVPSPDSDVDLLVVKDVLDSPIAEATRIRKAFRPLRYQVANLPLDIMVRSPEDLQQRIDRGADFHKEILTRGLVLL